MKTKEIAVCATAMIALVSGILPFLPDNLFGHILAAILVALIVGGPAALALLKLTRWGRENEQALDAVTYAVQAAKEQNKIYAVPVLDEMTKTEKSSHPNVVKTWKASVKRAKKKRETRQP